MVQRIVFSYRGISKNKKITVDNTYHFLNFKANKIMRKILGLFLISTLVLACSGNKEKKAELDNSKVAVDSTAFINTHTAQNSLDYTGTYKGILPCADCEKIEIELTITDSTFTRALVSHKNGEAIKTEDNGTFSWTNNGSVIVLDGITDSPSKYFVGENTLTQLDLEGNKITGDLADMYILKKQ